MSGAPSRRGVLAAGLALPVTGALAGCAPDRPRPSGGRGPTRITFWSAIRGSQEVVDAFNATHDTIRVDFEQIPAGTQGGYAKLSNAARAGNAPDVATLEYPQLPGFAIDGVATDLTDLVSDRTRDVLLPQALERATFDGRIYALPLDIEPMVMHYRQDLFDEHGFEAPRTWEDFADLGLAVRDRLPGSRITVFPTDGGTQFASYACQAGAQWFDTDGDTWTVSLTDAPTRRVAEYWQGLIDDDIVFANSVGGPRYPAQVGEGTVLVRLSGAWDAGAQMSSHPGQKGLWTVAPLPEWEPGAGVLGDHGGSTFTVTRDSRHPEAAMEFIEWQVSHPDAMRARLSAGTSSAFPVVDELVEVGREALDPEYYGGQDIYGLFAQEAVKVRDDWVWGPRMTSTLNLMHDNFARAGAGRGTLLDAMRAAQDGTTPDLRALGLSISEQGG